MVVKEYPSFFAWNQIKLWNGYIYLKTRILMEERFDEFVYFSKYRLLVT